MSSSPISPSASLLIPVEIALVTIRARSESSDSVENAQKDATCDLERHGETAAAIRREAPPTIGSTFIFRRVLGRFCWRCGVGAENGLAITLSLVGAGAAGMIEP